MNKKHKFIVSVLMLLAFGLLNSTNAQQPKQYPKMSNEAAEEMKKTYFFYMGQVYSVKLFSEKFPDLSTKFKIAQGNFDGEFGASIDNIDSILSIETTQWTELKQEVFKEIKQFADSSNQTNYSQALKSLDNINSRAKGDIPSPFLETLLTYNPAFLKQPEQEFLGKYVRVFSTKEHPKSKGVDFQISYPKSWKAKEGKRPNVITLIDSENGRGLEDVILAVKELPIAERKLSVKEEKELFSPDIIKQMLPQNAKIVSSTPMKIDGLSSMAVVFDTEQIQLDFKLKSSCLFFITLYKNKLIFLQFYVTSLPNEEKNLILQFSKFEPLFRLMANSLLVNNQ